MKEKPNQNNHYNLDELFDRKNKRLQKDAIRLASKAATVLSEYGAGRVFVFGSVLKAGRFYQSSDIDLAVEGLPKDNRFKVESRLMDIFEPEGFDFDLVIIEELRKRESPKAKTILETIYQEGKCLIQK